MTKLRNMASAVGKNHKFNDWLNKEMNKRGWSQSDLARSSELNRAVINKLLNGQTLPRPATLEAIARALKAPVEQVYRMAGLLPEIPESESYLEEVMHHIRRIQNPQHRATILLLIKALTLEDEQERKRK
jgi:transcriptional regulator with XRE-family HTH domain